jgi:hypothetical protein
MNKNICSCERVIRVFVGLSVASLAFWGPQSMWFLLGLIPAATGLIGWCPAYTLLGINRVEACKTASHCCCKGRDNKNENGKT